jgi:hypothetical protein
MRPLKRGSIHMKFSMTGQEKDDICTILNPRLEKNKTKVLIPPTQMTLAGCF